MKAFIIIVVGLVAASASPAVAKMDKASFAAPACAGKPHIMPGFERKLKIQNDVVIDNKKKSSDTANAAT